MPYNKLRCLTLKFVFRSRLAESQERTGQAVRLGTHSGGRQTVPEDKPPNKGVLKLYAGLRKAKSSALVQARTGRIGFA